MWKLIQAELPEFDEAWIGQAKYLQHGRRDYLAALQIIQCAPMAEKDDFGWRGLRPRHRLKGQLSPQ